MECYHRGQVSFFLQISVHLNLENSSLEVDNPQFNQTEASIAFSFYIERPPHWTNYTAAEEFESSLQEFLSRSWNVDGVFDPSDGVTLALVNVGKLRSDVFCSFCIAQ